jgi:hypothetical protein
VTSPPVADMRVDFPPRAAEAVGASAGDVGASAGDVEVLVEDVGATTSPTNIDIDPIRAVPGVNTKIW